MGVSRRTLTRRFREEAGLSFGTWRRRVRLLEALTRQAEGIGMHEVAAAVGYRSPRAFHPGHDAEDLKTRCVRVSSSAAAVVKSDRLREGLTARSFGDTCGVRTWRAPEGVEDTSSSV